MHPVERDEVRVLLLRSLEEGEVGEQASRVNQQALAVICGTGVVTLGIGSLLFFATYSIPNTEVLGKFFVALVGSLFTMCGAISCLAACNGCRVWRQVMAEPRS